MYTPSNSHCLTHGRITLICFRQISIALVDDWSEEMQGLEKQHIGLNTDAFIYFFFLVGSYLKQGLDM